MGDRVENLALSVKLLTAAEGIEVTGQSPIYESAPVDVAVDQADYLNQVVGIEARLAPIELRQVCLAIEVEMGRDIKHGSGLPRTIDLDIICLGELVGEFTQIILPHPRYDGRRFVLQPLADIAPEFCDPVTGNSVRSMLENCISGDLQVYPIEKVRA